MTTEADQKTPKWLKHLQENSWEAEILISGGAIFSLFQLVDWVSKFVVHLKDIRLTEGINEVFIFLHLAINGLIIGFSTHLVLRSIWIALVCLRYAYPEGINFTRLTLHSRYLEEAKSTNLTQQILKMDHLSGLIFFGAISFVLIITGVILSSVIAVVARPLGNPFFWTYIIIYLIFVFDFVTLGRVFRRWNFIAAVYKPFYFFFNFITLAFIFRPWLQILFTNVNRWKLYFACILFFALSMFLTTLSITGPLHWKSILDARRLDQSTDESTLWTENFYDNKNDEVKRVAFASIQEDIVKDNYLRLFIPYTVRHDLLIYRVGAKDFKGIVSVKLDSVLLKPEWIYGDHSSTNQNGITAYIGIESITHGKHNLTIEMKNASWPFPLTIPFWKQ